MTWVDDHTPMSLYQTRSILLDEMNAIRASKSYTTKRRTY